MARAQPSGGERRPAADSSATFEPAPEQAPPAPAANAVPATVPGGDASPGPATPADEPGAEGPAAPPTLPPKPEAPRAEPAADSTEVVDERDKLKQGRHVHDGFYLRLGLGVGYVHATSSQDSTLKGWGVAPDIWIGGSPMPGLAIGVTLNGVSVSDPEVAITAADSGGLGAQSGTARGTLTYSVFGLFTDIYPDPTGGLHFMAGLNYSAFGFESDSGIKSDTASGVGLTGGVGYEAWIGNEWSLGPVARLHWASVSDASGTTTVVSPVFLLGFTYH